MDCVNKGWGQKVTATILGGRYFFELIGGQRSKHKDFSQMANVSGSLNRLSTKTIKPIRQKFTNVLYSLSGDLLDFYRPKNHRPISTNAIY